MLSDSIALTDASATSQTYELSFRQGYDSIRRHHSAESALNYKLEIKSTIDMNAASKPNRHLLSLSRYVEDTVTGEYKPVTVHAVITRHKDIDDSVVADLACQLGSLLMNGAAIDGVLVGEN